MSRKPITELIGGKGNRQHIWEAIRSLSPTLESFTDRDIWSALPQAVREAIDKPIISDYRKCLVAASILKVEREHTARTTAAFSLVKDEGIEAPRVRRDGSRVTQGLAQEQMWRTLRMLTADTNGRELAAHASTPAIPVSEMAALDYLIVLNAAGYLIRTKEGKGTGKGGVQARYRLKASRNTGPRPPMVCRTKVVYDPNEDKVVYTPRVTDEDATYGK